MRLMVSKLLYADIKQNDDHQGRRGLWRDSSWREILCGETSPRRESLRVEIISVKKIAEEHGEDINLYGERSSGENPARF